VFRLIYVLYTDKYSSSAYNETYIIGDIYIYMCVYACVYIHVYIHTRAQVRACMYICMHASMHIKISNESLRVTIAESLVTRRNWLLWERCELSFEIVFGRNKYTVFRNILYLVFGNTALSLERFTWIYMVHSYKHFPASSINNVNVLKITMRAFFSAALLVSTHSMRLSWLMGNRADF